MKRMTVNVTKQTDGRSSTVNLAFDFQPSVDEVGKFCGAAFACLLRKMASEGFSKSEVKEDSLRMIDRHFEDEENIKTVPSATNTEEKA
ncbi:MAG: hypothetical protein U0640_07795 [Phycisphaerales bacterium]